MVQDCRGGRWHWRKNEREIQNHSKNSWPISQLANRTRQTHQKTTGENATVARIPVYFFLIFQWTSMLKQVTIIIGNRQQFRVVVLHMLTGVLMVNMSCNKHHSWLHRFWPHFNTLTLICFSKGVNWAMTGVIISSCVRFSPEKVMSSFACRSLQQSRIKAFLEGLWTAVFADITLFMVGSYAVNLTHLENGKLNIHRA